ncbi:thioredoxin fold domain-containing protein [Desulforhopalus vacuolatus]|uniref:thioredoxin fold domain-containing protein n=1 Tax=Desulforhopalus vacuolatus TaxID=40414 RepID=UPI001962389F|nr:thioredoxin fold domain-containing protein [Desulforhopalus vacuolatus]MBM9519548.1 thioredoxin fold domain-containing protein [Desulforhopalus vacuolatus]
MKLFTRLAPVALALFLAVSAGAQCLSPEEVTKSLGLGSQEGRVVTSFPVRDLKNMCGYVVQKSDGYQIFYSNGQYFIFGRLIDFNRSVEVGEAFLKSMQTLPEAERVHLKTFADYTIGHGINEVILLTDPECPYCHQLEKAVTGLESTVTFYVILYPLDQHPAGQGATRRLMCRKSTLNTLADYSAMAEKLTAEPGIIDEPGCTVYEKKRAPIAEFFKKNNVQPAFPTLIFSNGYHISGALPREVFLKAIEQNSK